MGIMHSPQDITGKNTARAENFGLLTGTYILTPIEAHLSISVGQVDKYLNFLQVVSSKILYKRKVEKNWKYAYIKR